LYLISEKSPDKEPATILDGDESLERHGRRRYNSKLPRNSSRAHNPLSEVAVWDMKTGEITPVSYKPGII
jgi:hypothetical protein